MENREMLDSWKEISVYLNRSIKTCQRWETEHDLPIYRLDGSPRPSVFAYKDELDRWLAQTLKRAERPGTLSKHNKVKRTIYSLIAIISLIIVAAYLWRPWSRSLSPDSNSDKPSLAILYFENNSGDSTLDNWRYALPELLMADLQQSKYLNTLDGARIYGILKKLNL